MIWVRHGKTPIELEQIRKTNYAAYQFMVQATIKEITDENSRTKSGTKPTGDPKQALRG